MKNFVEIKKQYPIAFQKFCDWLFSKFAEVDKIEGRKSYITLVNNKGDKSKFYISILKTFAKEKNFEDVKTCFETLNNNN